MSNVMNTPAEVIEANYPILIERQALRRGSGGAGHHRGGDGQVRVYRVVGPEMALTTMVERCRIPPFGLCGGAPGKVFCITLERASGEKIQLAGKTSVHLKQGDRIIMQSSGGGGFGAATA
jgi:N-methylhydantoinase B